MNLSRGNAQKQERDNQGSFVDQEDKLNMMIDDPSGYWWPPTYSIGSKQLFQFGSLSTVFWVLNFQGHFEALHNFFWHHIDPGDSQRILPRLISLLYSLVRLFQWSLKQPKWRSYSKVTPSGSWHTNLPLRGPQNC